MILEILDTGEGKARILETGFPLSIKLRGPFPCKTRRYMHTEK